MDVRTYIAIDLKSFYASVECVERGLDPLDTHLVVADERRTDKTICLAVTPSLRALGIPGRSRLFEVIQQVRSINVQRLRNAPGQMFVGSSYSAAQLAADPCLSLEYIIAPPRMAYYIEYSTRIYQIYLKYVAPEDIHAYSIDEVFIDATKYVNLSSLSAHDLAMEIILDVLRSTGITATAGIGTNLYLCKVAMDIVAKHIPADENGVRIAELDEKQYRHTLWSHRPLTDFWRVGKGYARKLEAYGMYTMGDVARMSIRDEELLYHMFGINAELLIDHAWGWESCTIADIKAYRPETHSISAGQVLTCPYSFKKARLVVREMAEALALELVDKRLVAAQIVLDVGYEHQTDKCEGEFKKDRYGRSIPKPAHGSVHLIRQTSSAKLISEAVMQLYNEITNPELTIRRLNLTAAQVIDKMQADQQQDTPEQLNMFTDYEKLEKQRAEEERKLERENRRQKAILEIKKRYGKNALLLGVSLMDGATAKERNQQIGGHKA